MTEKITISISLPNEPWAKDRMREILKAIRDAAWTEVDATIFAQMEVESSMERA